MRKVATILQLPRSFNGYNLSAGLDLDYTTGSKRFQAAEQSRQKPRPAATNPSSQAASIMATIPVRLVATKKSTMPLDYGFSLHLETVSHHHQTVMLALRTENATLQN